MRKSIWLMMALMFSMFISGCGGGTTTSVVASTTTALAPSDVSNKTFYSTTTNSTKGYIAFQIYSGGSAKWDSTENTDPVPKGDVSGTWAIVNGQLVLSVAGTPAYQFTCIQKELTYFFTNEIKYGESNNIVSNQITRTYFNQLDAQTYLNTIAIATPNGNGVMMGGGVQGIPLTTTFTNISTVVGVTGQTPVTFADYTATKTAGTTPPVILGRVVGSVMINGTLFVLDNSGGRIQMVTLDSNGATKVKTLGSTSTPSVDLTFNNPSDITTDGVNLYVTDSSNCTIDKITLAYDSTNKFYTGTLTYLAGSPGVSQAYDGTGNTQTIGTTAGTVGTARFIFPIGITTDGTNLYVTDNNAIRKIDIGSIGSSSSVAPQVTTLAGYPGQAGTADAVSTAARFNLPLRITTDGTNLYVTDSNNYTIRKVAIATGQVTTIAGSPGTFGTNKTQTIATGDLALFNGPNGITTDGTNLYVTDWGPVTYGAPIRGQVIFSIAIANPTNPTSQYSGQVKRIAGMQDAIATGANQPSPLDPTAALFNCPTGLTTDGTSLYVADTNNYTIRRIK